MERARADGESLIYESVVLYSGCKEEASRAVLLYSCSGVVLERFRRLHSKQAVEEWKIEI
jgi:hypothetical protein